MIDKIRTHSWVAIGLLYVLASLFKLSPVQGLWGVQFSWSQLMIPVMGAFAGISGCYALVGSILLLRVIGSLFGTAMPFFFGLPTLFSSLYWVTHYRSVRAGIPALCMLLFVMHPVGFYAAPYALYWLIPIAVAFWPKHRFLTALASTFTAHAVGSIMHLYCINSLSAAAWLQLIPMVAVERLCLATGMWLAYVGFRWLSSRDLYRRTYQKFATVH